MRSGRGAASAPSSPRVGTPGAGSPVTSPLKKVRRPAGKARLGADPAAAGAAAAGAPDAAERPAGGSLPSSGGSEAAALEDLLAAPDAGDAVKVVVRIRPLCEREAREGGGATCLSVPPGAPRAVLLSEPSRAEPYAASFDAVLPPEAGQDDVFAAAGAELVDNCMAGLNSSIFAYGQTGSGKTHTMMGDPDGRAPGGGLRPAAGLALRVFDALFARVAAAEEARGRGAVRYSVKCSFLEIYNEEVSDLLAPAPAGGAAPPAPPLQIRDGDAKRGVYVQGLSETEVLNADDVLALLQRGAAARTVAATKMNERSSRAHSVFTATVEAHERAEGSGVTAVRYSKLNLIDLAGSERVGKSGAAGAQLAEAKNINKSLTVLGRVIAALGERAKPGRGHVHVPYRDSRLTFLLQESLGGNSKTAIIACVTPAAAAAQETHGTLVFASGAKKIRCRAVVNQDTLGDAAALRAENARLRERLAAAEGGDGARAEAAALRAQLDAARALFDQNNEAIAALRAERGELRRAADAARAAAERLAEEAAQLRADNAALGAEAEAARDAAGAAAAAADAARAEAAAAREAAAAADAARAAAEARADGVAAEAAAAAAAAEAARRDAAAAGGSVERYRRMVGEIGRLIDWAQLQRSPGVGPAAGGGARASGAFAAPSPLGPPPAVEALRRARASLGAGLAEPLAARQQQQAAAAAAAASPAAAAAEPPAKAEPAAAATAAAAGDEDDAAVAEAAAEAAASKVTTRVRGRPARAKAKT